MRDHFRRTGHVAPVDNLLRELVGAHDLTVAMRAHRVLIEWPTLVGPSIARVTAPDGLRDGVLSVWVKTSPWMQELRQLRDRLVADLNRALGDPPLVREIRLHFGSSRIVAEDDPLARLRLELARRRPPPRRIPTPARGEHAAAIERDTAIVEDEDLRAVIASVRLKYDR